MSSLSRSNTRMLNRFGRDMVLKRRIVSTSVAVEDDPEDDSQEISLHVKGVRVGGALIDAGNTATQQEFRVVIGAAELNRSTWTDKVPSAATDHIIVDDVRRRVLDVQPQHDGETICSYDLLVAG